MPRPLTIDKFEKKLQDMNFEVENESQLMSIIFCEENMGNTLGVAVAFFARFPANDHLRIMNATQDYDHYIALASKDEQVQLDLIKTYGKNEWHSNHPGRVLSGVIQNAISPQVQRELMKIKGKLYAHQARGILVGSTMTQIKMLQCFIQNDAPADVFLAAAEILAQSSTIRLALQTALEKDPKMTKAHFANYPDRDYYSFPPSFIKVLDSLDLAKGSLSRKTVTAGRMNVVQAAVDIALS